MASCLAELHLWSSRSSLHVRDTDIGTYQFYDKGQPGTFPGHHYFNEKQQFLESRGYPWALKNRRPEKLRDSLKELEELLQNSPCVCSRWKNKQSGQLLLNSGVLVTLSHVAAQLERVSIDRVLVGRLPADTISHAVITDKVVLLTFVEKSQVCLIHLNRRTQGSPETSRRVEKLSPSELKICGADLPGGAGRCLGRHVGLNRLQDVAICWWPALNEEARPWSPLPSETDRANLVLLGCAAAPGLKILSSVRTEGDPLDCCFSLTQPYQLLTVEVPTGPGSMAHSCVYECARGRLQRLSATTLPLPSRPVSCSRDPSETRLLLGLHDSSLVLYDVVSGISLQAHCPMLPSLSAWHPAGALLVVGGEQGELQCFDLGLSTLPLQLVAEDVCPSPTLQLCQHLRTPGGLVGLQWPSCSYSPGTDGLEVHDVLLLSFHCGPLAALRLRLGALTGGQAGPVELVQQRLRCGQVDEALGILGAMDWSTMGEECYRALSSVTEHLLRLGLNLEREAQLEAALGVFYMPSRPLSDSVILEFRDAISRYARRFFHHLLRHQRFEKAFLLAVNIGARDLFMDIHYVATDKGELVLADVAKKKANEIDAESLTSGTGEQQDAAVGETPVQGREGRGPGRTRLSRSVRAPRKAGEVKGADAELAAGRVWPWKSELNHLDMSDESNEDPGRLKLIHLGSV
ncbi:WD repeat-containing and planar cell polarity effector protein fritz homolog isoform X2 [Denticeps clupeoides]|uniref:WD repeat-containing and planar cell polarity effector protein fritz homolog n=1 Tax=Denticeps clupeoides TaxID=299321 RepID=A0AAY4DNB0_9TELE|nr:WD repeat-containing and planar cell polarity effector protein fritz homolog isoform X2 [Denticeps clupeoides]